MSKTERYVFLPLVIACSAFLFIGGPDADSLRSFRYIWGLGHIICFFLWACLYASWRAEQSFVRIFFEVLLLSFIFGGLTELIQGQIGREASWKDLANDMIGGMAGLLFLAGVRRTLPKLWLRLLQAPCLLLLLWILFPAARVIVDDLVARQQFPLLSGFETDLEQTRWNGSIVRQVTDRVYFQGKRSLRIVLSTQRYAGIGLKDFPRDWRGFREFSMQVYNPDSEPLTLHFRIHDRRHNQDYRDRYNASFDILPGWNHLQVSLADVEHSPEGRLLDLSHIAGMGVFVGKLDRPRIVFLDDVKLVP